ncbi:amino acid ABC transporter ATP-binding protein [Eupransor demetentiae]|uniref:ATPase component (GlnQ) n=1 Tax=Eupransor demetentiae TaxID=3109584 RepID=A0ABM9N438_9LACO|nr:ABC-type polar amino acid transport system [Lactobacillaceae bacterium LMG 33000]
MLKIHNFQKKFNNREVLKSINLDVDKGEVLALLGPSGSRKTTFLRGLAFLTPGDAGEITINDKQINIDKITKAEIKQLRDKMGFVFQNFNLFQNKTVLQNLTEGLIYGHHFSKDEAEKLAKKALAKVGLLKFINHYPHQLSGGQAQRVGIARATVLDPEIILFDEPTSALDPELVIDVLKVIKQLADEGKTLIVVTHEMAFAKEVADQVVFMDGGVIVEKNHAKPFFEEPKSQRLKDFLSRIDVAKSLAAIQ